MHDLDFNAKRVLSGLRGSYIIQLSILIRIVTA